MRRAIPNALLLVLLPLLFQAACLDADSLAEPLQHTTEVALEAAGILEERIPPPTGFARMAAPDGSFAAWLRQLPLRADRPPVRLFDGSLKRYQQAHHAVFDIDVGDRDLQQCADAVIRLRAEYLFSLPCEPEIVFHFTSGDPASWHEWTSGLRPRVDGNEVSWVRSASTDTSYDNFRRYLDSVFTYAGTYSLSRELRPVSEPNQLLPGDVFIQGGFPGHAVLVVDVAADQAGSRVFLLAQSYMPAQDIHLLINPDPSISPWYPAESQGTLRTPEWRFDYSDIRRFPDFACGQGTGTGGH